MQRTCDGVDIVWPLEKTLTHFYTNSVALWAIHHMAHGRMAHSLSSTSAFDAMTAETV